VITILVVWGVQQLSWYQKDLHYWYPLHIDPTSTNYNHFVDVAVLRDKIVVITGKELLMFNSRDVEEAFRRKPF